jgi:thiol-disulfide isomerase/thioredoxin
LVAIALAACDNSSERAAPKSRVQAVLESGGSTAAPAAEPKARLEPASSAAAEPKKPRPPLCGDQLEAAPRAFNPRRTPEQRSLVEHPLPEDPLKPADKRWNWVNFWAAWCVPCKQELPLLLSWEETLARDLRFTFVSLDDDERQLRGFLEQQPDDGLKSSYWLPDGATRQAWLRALGLESEPELPLQVLMDASGKLRCRVEGAVEAQDFTTLQQIVRHN